MTLLEGLIKECKKSKEFQEEYNGIKYCRFEKRIKCKYQEIKADFITNKGWQSWRYKCLNG